jgi:hypothetical protein
LGSSSVPKLTSVSFLFPLTTTSNFPPILEILISYINSFLLPEKDHDNKSVLGEDKTPDINNTGL